MDGRKKNKGKKGNAGGNPGYGKLEFLKQKVEQFAPLWWEELENMMLSKPDEFINDNVKEIIKELIKKGEAYTAKEVIEGLARGAFSRKQFAMQEFNKIQTKMIPTDIESGGKPLVIQFDPTFHAITREPEENSPEPSEV